jgi:hypothetical protein
LRKMLLAVIAISAIAMPAYAADTWWQTGGYKAGCVTKSPIPGDASNPADAFGSGKGILLRDHGDYVDIIDTKRWPLSGDKDVLLYRFFRSKDICLQQAAEGDKELDEFFGTLKKQRSEELCLSG